MRNFVYLLLVFITALMLSGSSLLKDTPLEGLGNIVVKPYYAVTGEHPERPLKDFLGVMHSKEYSKASNYLTEAGKNYYPEKNMTNFIVETGFTVKAVEIDPKDINIARVYYSLENTPGQVALTRKVKGTWKVEEFGADDNYRFDN